MGFIIYGKSLYWPILYLYANKNVNYQLLINKHNIWSLIFKSRIFELLVKIGKNKRKNIFQNRRKRLRARFAIIILLLRLILWADYSIDGLNFYCLYDRRLSCMGLSALFFIMCVIFSNKTLFSLSISVTLSSNIYIFF